MTPPFQPVQFNEQGLQSVALAQIIATKLTDDQIAALAARITALEQKVP